MGTGIFLREFFSHWREVGSVIPSSRFLARTMLREIDFSRTLHIVELGPGTGTITRELLRRMTAESTLTAVEINPTFCTLLARIGDPRLHVVEGSAFSLHTVFKDNTADHIVSGIPLATLPVAEQRALTRTVAKLLHPQGTFIQFQYSLDAHRLLREAFPEIRTSFTMLNIPPAVVYRCTHVSSHGR